MNLTILGVAAALLAALLAVGMPVAPHRVNQRLIDVILAVLIATAAICLVEMPLALLVAAGSFIVIIGVRDIIRFARHAVYGVTKYTRRDYWYRRVGRAVLGGRSRSHRW